MKHNSISLAGGEVSAAAARIQALWESGHICPLVGYGLQARVVEAGRLAAARLVSPEDARRVAFEAENAATSFAPLRRPSAAKVDVYFNSRKGLWSVREGGRVTRHVPAIALRDVRFIALPGAVARVQRRGHREVCAYARGTPVEAPLDSSAFQIAFDPFYGPEFLDRAGFVYTRASLVHFLEDATCWAVI